jgi:hemophore-related protein
VPTVVDMKHIAVIVSAAAAGALGMGFAVPALADTGSSGSSSASNASQLSSSQLSSIEQFLTDHPNLAQALAGRAASWQKFLAANPSIKAELAKVATLPADQRKSDLKAWLQANPSARTALQEYRLGNKAARLTQRQDRLKQRLQKLQSPSSSSSSSSGTSGSSSSSVVPGSAGSSSAMTSA